MVRGGEARTAEQQLVVEYGITLDGVWLPLAMLRRLGTHGPWDPPFTEATADQERVLLAHLLAERHNQAGLHRGLSLPDLLDAIPFQPTEPFGKISDGDRTRVGPGRASGMIEGDTPLEGASRDRHRAAARRA